MADSDSSDEGYSEGEDDESVHAILDDLRKAVSGTLDVHRLVWDGDLDCVREMIDAAPDAKDAEDRTELGEGFKPLHYAAYQVGP